MAPVADRETAAAASTRTNLREIAIMKTPTPGLADSRYCSGIRHFCDGLKSRRSVGDRDGHVHGKCRKGCNRNGLGDCLLDVAQPVLAEVDGAVDEEGRDAKSAAIH